MRKISKTLGLCWLLVSGAAAAEGHVKAELLSDRDTIAPGGSFRLGVRFTVPDRSHIYWSNPGESGLPTAIEWAVPEGVQVGELAWPNPVSFHDKFLDETTFGYTGEVLLFSAVYVPADAKPADTMILRAQATWLVCLEDGACIPEDASLEIALKVGDREVPSKRIALFDAYAQRVPRDAGDLSMPLTVLFGDEPSTSVRAKVERPWRIDPASSEFFPNYGGPWVPELTPDSRVLTFQLRRAIDGDRSGALTLALENEDTGERRVIAVRVPAPEGD